MSRRTKLIILGIFLLLLAIPAWHVGSNWNPPNPLRFRLLSTQRLPVTDGRRNVRLEIEVRNTTTAPRYIYHAVLKQTREPLDPFAPGILEPRMLVPAGGVVRVRAESWYLTEESITPGPLEMRYLHASTSRDRLTLWCDWMVQRLPENLRAQFEVPHWSESIAPVESTPQDSTFSP